jgi:hypothetical protein
MAGKLAYGGPVMTDAPLTGIPRDVASDANQSVGGLGLQQPTQSTSGGGTVPAGSIQPSGTTQGPQDSLTPTQQQYRAQVAQANGGFNLNNLRIPPDPMIQSYQQMLRDQRLSPEYRMQILNEYRQAIQPRKFSLAGGYIMYDPRTGQPISSYIPELQKNREKIGPYEGDAPYWAHRVMATSDSD